MTKTNYKVITVNLPKTIIEFLDSMVKKGLACSRSEFLRMCLYYSIPAILNRENAMLSTMKQPEVFIVEEFESKTVVEVNGKVYQIPPKEYQKEEGDGT